MDSVSSIRAIEAMKLITNMKMPHLFQVLMTIRNPIDSFTCHIDNAPMAVHGFNLILQYAPADHEDLYSVEPQP